MKNEQILHHLTGLLNLGESLVITKDRAKELKKYLIECDISPRDYVQKRVEGGVEVSLG